MKRITEAPKLLSIEDKWKIIFNEINRSPIYSAGHYIHYLHQFTNGPNIGTSLCESHSNGGNPVIRDGILHPVSYLLRKLKLDMKMSHDSFLEDFLKPENNGMNYLVKTLKIIQRSGSQKSHSTNTDKLLRYKKTLTDEHDCLLCIKYSLRIEVGVISLLEINYALETVAMCLISAYTKSRGTAIEILTLTLTAADGFSRILDCFTHIQLQIGEPIRFKSLLNMINMDSSHDMIFKVCAMKFLNSLLASNSNMNMRVHLQHELELAGLDSENMSKICTGAGLKYDELRYELDEWRRKYINVDQIMLHHGNNQLLVADLQKQIQELSADKAHLEYQLRNVRTEMQYRYDNLHNRTPLSSDVSVQCNNRQSNTKDAACQCDYIPQRQTGSTLKSTAQFFRCQDVFFNDEDNKELCPEVQTDSMYEHTITDDEDVFKVQHWLQSQFNLSDNDVNILPSTTDDYNCSCSLHQTFHFNRNSYSRRTLHKNEFPGNWKSIPKSIEQFPTRFQLNQCHHTNCDRCNIKNRPENSKKAKNKISRNTDLHIHLNGLGEQIKHHDTGSQCTDSAIGGSSDKHWNVQQIISLGTPEINEADILQDLIQPDDSASACPALEPYPDYSVISVTSEKLS